MKHAILFLITLLFLISCSDEKKSDGNDSVPTNPSSGMSAGNPDGKCAIPKDGQLKDVSKPTQIVGGGTKESCSAKAFTDAVAKGGIITFNCGSEPVTIILTEPAKVFNNTTKEIVIDGGGKVTLSGGGKTRILYMNTCDQNQVWTTDHCNNQDHPQLTVIFIDGNSKNETDFDGGGAIWVRGGLLTIINSRFFNNNCASTGADVGGGAVRVFDMFEKKPVYVVNSTFGGKENYGNIGANGGAISSIGVSWEIINSIFSYNEAVGNGGNPAQDGTPGGGSGGAIYNDGNYMKLSICGSIIEYNKVNAYGAAIFFVTNDHSGVLKIIDSIIRDNIGGSWHTLPGISMHSDTKTEISGSTIED